MCVGLRVYGLELWVYDSFRGLEFGGWGLKVSFNTYVLLSILITLHDLSIL